jgi:O-antigen ligase
MFTARNAFWVWLQAKSFILTLIIFVVHVQFVDTYFKVDKYIKLIVIFGLYFAIMGIIGKGRVLTPTLGDENDFCLWMNILLPLAYFLGQDTEDKRLKLFWYLCGATFILANVASFSRGGFIGLVAVGCFLLFKSKRKIAGVFLIGLFVFVISLYAPSNYWDEIESIKTENTQEGTGKERIDSWKAGWRMFLDYPIIGVGPRNYGIWLPEYWSGDRSPENMWGRVAHSLYFTLISEMGIIGTLLFISILFKNYQDHKYIYELNKRKNELTAGANLSKEKEDQILRKIKSLYALSLGYTGGMVAYLVTGAFISVLWYKYFWMFTSYWVMTSNIAKNIETELNQSNDAISPNENTISIRNGI